MMTSLRRTTSLSKRALASAALQVAGPISLVTALLLAPAAFGVPPSRDAQRLKNDNDREARDRLRRVEQQRKDEQWRRDWQDRQQRDAQERARREAQWAEAAKSQTKTPAASAFNASTAPPPDDCLKFFIKAARSATSMEQLLPYLPESEQKRLREKQASFDSQSAQSSEYVRPPSSSFTDDQLAPAAASPYEAALQMNRSFARQIMDILDVKVVGDQAELTVATGYYINDRPVPDGKAYVQMAGEGSYWRVKTNDSSPLAKKPRLNGP